MKRLFILVLLIHCAALALFAHDYTHESKVVTDARMKWFRDARLGMFIHWGLYSIPAGEWNGKTEYGEWIRNNAHIPVTEYDKFVQQFNPVKFDAKAWVRMAKDAGMKYIVITTKHHDGFNMFDSKETDFDIMSTPFKRDVMKELAAACRKEGMKLCFYHSIMDWHHPDYLPRREWEKDRSAEGADFNRFKTYLKAELKELLTNYGDIGIIWFDGNWESTWSNEQGKDLYNYVRSLQPKVIINNRVGQPPPSESGVGFRDKGEVGDYGTPEQEIPATGMPDMDWETCMTMNDHWGYNNHDTNFKSSTELIRDIADIASKGGNFLLNVGPTSEGLFPEQSVRRLHDIGTWMKVNGEAVYGTQASPFKHLAWGRATRKAIAGGTRLYLHVFDWPKDGKLVVPGIMNVPKSAWLIAGISKLSVHRKDASIIIDLPPVNADSIESIDRVVVLDVAGQPDVVSAPEISASAPFFTDYADVKISSSAKNVEIWYSFDGTAPTKELRLMDGPIRLTATATISARCFRGGKVVSEIATATFKKVEPRPAYTVSASSPGLRYAYYEFPGDVEVLPDFSKLTVVAEGVNPGIDVTPKKQPEHFGLVYSGYIDIPSDGVYTFNLESDDGSRLFIDDSLAVDSDGLHGMTDEKGMVALAKGLHSLRLAFFQNTGGVGLKLSISSREMTKREVGGGMVVH